MHHILKIFWLIDRRRLTAYKFTFVLHMLGAFFGVATYYYLGKHARLESDNLFRFILLGFIPATWLVTIPTSMAQQLEHHLKMRSLELMVASPTPLRSSNTCMVAWPLTQATVLSLLYLLLAQLLFDFRFSFGQYLNLFLQCLICLPALIGMGWLLGAMVLLFKKGAPWVFACSAFHFFFCGVYFDIQLLPKSLFYLSLLSPVTFALDNVRQGFFVNPIENLLLLALQSMAFWFVGKWSFEAAVKKIKSQDSFAHT